MAGACLAWQSLGCQGIRGFMDGGTFLDGKTKVTFLEGDGKGRGDL